MAPGIPEPRDFGNLSAKSHPVSFKIQQRLLEVAVLTPSQSAAGEVLLPKRIVLTGFMGAGKSTLGPRLAQRIGWIFVDLDDEIVRAEQQSIAQIFDSLGEAGFRVLEQRALAAAMRREDIVLALGGGAVETAANRELIQQDDATLLLYLAAPLETLIERCEQQELLREAVRRPILEKRAELTERFERRRPLYELADWTIETTGKSLDELVHAIMLQWDNAPLEHRA